MILLVLSSTDVRLYVAVHLLECIIRSMLPACAQAVQGCCVQSKMSAAVQQTCCARAPTADAVGSAELRGDFRYKQSKKLLKPQWLRPITC